VTAEIPAPVELGEAHVVVDALRAGNSLSTLRAAIVQRGETKAHAVAILAKPRTGGAPLAWQELVRPDVPPWPRVPVSPFGEPGGPWPEFTQHFELRIHEGVPYTGPAAPARTSGWVRPRHPGPHRDAAFIAACIDAWYPAALARFTAWRPMATIAFTLDLVGSLAGLDPDAPLLYRGTVPVCADGYFLETRELWGEDGRLVAINQQTFAVIA
jgi:acyl-CoA thioesterase